MGWSNSSGWTTPAGGWSKAAAAAGGSPVLFTYNFLTSPSMPTGLSLTRATTGTVFDSSGVMQTAAIDAARFENTYNGTSWIAAGLLVEEQRTNSVVSRNMSSVWSTNSIASIAQTTGVDGGSNTAFLVPPDTSNTFHQIARSTDITTASPVSYLIYFKASGYSQVFVRESGSTGAGVAFTGSGAGSVGATYNNGGVTITNPQIVNVSNGYYRATALFSPTGSTGLGPGLMPFDGSYVSGNPFSATYAGNGTSGLIFFGPQMEVGGFPTSYIPTSGSAVTRSADLVSASGTLATQLAAGPSVWEMQDQASGTISRTSYAAGAFSFPTSKLYRSFGVYPSGTNTTPYLTVGGAY